MTGATITAYINELWILGVEMRCKTHKGPVLGIYKSRRKTVLIDQYRSIDTSMLSKSTCTLCIQYKILYFFFIQNTTKADILWSNKLITNSWFYRPGGERVLHCTRNGSESKKKRIIKPRQNIISHQHRYFCWKRPKVHTMWLIKCKLFRMTAILLDIWSFQNIFFIIITIYGKA